MDTSYIVRSGGALDSIHQSKGEDVSSAELRSSVQGLNLSDAENALIRNSKCFEAGVSMAILDNPGQIGSVFDQNASALKMVLGKVLDPDSAVGKLEVVLGNAKLPLVTVLERTLINPLSEKSDQIGRQPPGTEKTGQAWLLEALGQPLVNKGGSNGDNYDFRMLLTKIRALSGFGTAVWQLMNPSENTRQPELYAATRQENLGAIKALLREAFGNGEVADQFEQRFAEFADKTRTPAFDNPISRARSERMPMVQGSDGELRTVHGQYEDAAKYGLGFGSVVQQVRPEYAEAEQAQLRAALGERNENINSISRENAPIADLNRPFALSEEDLRALPPAYEKLNIAEQLEQHAFNHGTGMNRWQPYGTFALDESKHGFPAAGAQSGGTCDVLLALTTLSPKSLYGDADTVMPATLGISAFMNFGAYHTFAETFPIGSAMAMNKPYVPSLGTFPELAPIHERFAHAALHYSNEAAKPAISDYAGVYQALGEEIRKNHPELAIRNDGPAVEIHATPAQMEAWRNAPLKG